MGRALKRRSGNTGYSLDVCSKGPSRYPLGRKYRCPEKTIGCTKERFRPSDEKLFGHQRPIIGRQVLRSYAP